MKITSLLIGLCVVGSGIGVSTYADPPATLGVAPQAGRSLLPIQPSGRPGFAGVSADSPSRPGYAGALRPGESAMAERGARSVTLPLEAQYAVSAALGKDQTAYHVVPNRKPLNREPLNHAETSYRAANPNQHFDARFDAQGACVTSDGTHWDLSVQAWGYDDPDFDQAEDYSYPASLLRQGFRLRQGYAGQVAGQAVVWRPASGIWCPSSGVSRLSSGVWHLASGVRRPVSPSVSANRVEYRREALTEWYVNGPLGLQQGFTVNSPPARHSPAYGPLTLVLNLPAGADQAQIDADRTGLTLLTDSAIGGSASGGKSGPALRYSGLTALDADGRRLSAWLETRDHALLLRVDDTKARYPITIDPFIQQAKLTADDGAANDYFGVSVALSSDGNMAIVGAYTADVGGNAAQGAAYVFTRSAVAWTQQAKLMAADGAKSNYFGSSVALSSDGNTAIVGAYNAAADVNADRGAAYVFTRSATAWSQQWKLIAWDGGAHDYFGNSVALSSDGNTAIVGAYHADVGVDADQGKAYVFTRFGAGWNNQATLMAADGAAHDYFGNSVALSGDGNTACVGAYYADVGVDADQGAAYVFTRSGAAWSQQDKLIVLSGAASDLFGVSVALSGDGNTALAGAYTADVGGTANQGAAYVFTRSGAAWSQQVKLTAADGAAHDYLGSSVALSSDGNTALAGAYAANVGGNANQGAAYVFAVPTPPTGVAATDDFYIDRVRVTWDTIAYADGYELWRGASNDPGLAALIGAVSSGTTYDDMDATAGTPYYYWVKTTNAGGASAFSASALGKVLLGSDVRLNGSAGPVALAAGSALAVTVSMNPAQNAGAPRDWWVVASTPVGLYYLNSGMAWTPASALADCQPVYQGGLFGLQSAVVLDTTALPAGTYTFYFGVDTLNGILDPDVVYDSATVTVAP